MNSGYYSGNEVMFRRGIKTTEDLHEWFKKEFVN
jgi:hypothetical protein